MSHNNTMSQAKAASFLGVTERTVRNYIKKGLLSKVKSGRHTLIPAEDVLSLKEDIDSAFPVVSRQELLRLRSKVRRLESNMEVVLQMLDTKESPLSLSESYAAELYEFAHQHLQKGMWDNAEIEPWVEIFNRLSEEDMETLNKASGNPHPWKPFVQLCAAMMSNVVSSKEYETSLELQSLHRKLSASRRRLRVSSFIYAETRGDMDRELSSPVVPATMADALFSKILKTG